MNEEKFNETETSATETVAESLETADTACADSLVAAVPSSTDVVEQSMEESTNSGVATETVAEAPYHHDTVCADDETDGLGSEPKTLQDKIKYAFTKPVAKKNAKALANRWFIDAFTGMAQGLFVTLIAGTIIKQIGLLFGDNGFGRMLVLIGNLACMLMGAGIGVGIAKKLGVSDLLLFACATAGFIGAFLPDAAFKVAKEAAVAGTTFDLVAVASKISMLKLGIPGNPISAYVGTLLALELVRLYAGKTKLDILIVPLGVLFLSFVNTFLSIPAIYLVDLIGQGIELATEAVPFVMGVVIAVVMGILLTMPTSSAAIWISIAMGKTSPVMLLAGGAATVGCACQMVGFAVASFKENGVGGLISQGVGTSMLQIPNIMRNPRIFIPPIVASAICGPLSTCLFKLRCGASGGGMGTSGFVGIIDMVSASGAVTDAAGNVLAEALPAWQLWLGIILLMIVLPALISWGMSVLLRKVGWIKDGDMSLDFDKKTK